MVPISRVFSSRRQHARRALAGAIPNAAEKEQQGRCDTLRTVEPHPAARLLGHYQMERDTNPFRGHYDRGRADFLAQWCI